jgi:hypothetical protein
MKKGLIILLVSLFSFLTAPAQNIREVFRAMPDSIMPYLTKNAKLDMMDFMDANMKAAVNNELGGESRMLFLSDDSLAIKMSNALMLELSLEKADTNMVIVMKRTYQIKERHEEVLINRFSSSWRPMSESLVRSTLLGRDDEVFSKPHF